MVALDWYTVRAEFIPDFLLDAILTDDSGPDLGDLPDIVAVDQEQGTAVDTHGSAVPAARHRRPVRTRGTRRPVPTRGTRRPALTRGTRSFFRLRPVKYPLHGALDQVAQVYLGLDGDLGRGHLGVVTILGQLPGLLDQSEPVLGRRIVLKDIQRVLAGMEPSLADHDVTVVLVGLADLVLETAAPEVLVEALDTDYGLLDCRLGFCFLAPVGMVNHGEYSCP